MLESLSNLQLLILLFGVVASACIFIAWCIRRFLLQVTQPSKNILWLIAAQMFLIGCASCLIDKGCQYLSVYEFVFRGGPSYCTLPKLYWSGIALLSMASISVTIYWLVKSPLSGGVGRIRHLKVIFDD